jgi:deoxycytidine triphosphate deaminase
MVLLRSSAARAGYEHSFAGWIDPGFRGTIVAELRNNLSNHMLPIEPGMRLLQVVLMQMTAAATQPYSVKGNYQDQTGATGSNYNFSRLAA